jgi:SAM-dependent methyltransferase
VPELGGLGRRVVEVGCGPGLDAATLLRQGFEVVAFDRVAVPLARARAIAPSALLVRADLSRRLPFRDETFDCAVSSLAMHYLPWAETRGAFADVRRVLRPGAPFLFRVNASDDVHHGAGQGEQLEPGLFRSPGSHFGDVKRFFDEEMVRAAVEALFDVERLEHVTIHRYEMPKRAWECLARRV